MHEWGTQCYALSKNGMKYFLEFCEKNGLIVADLPLFSVKNEEINMYYCSNKIIFDNKNFPSTIQK